MKKRKPAARPADAPPKKNPGTPTKYTPETITKICNYVRLGLKYADACAMAGISEAIFYDWKANKSEFLERLKQAEIEGKAANLAIINQARGKDWRASGWLLERRHVDEFGRTRIEMTGKDGKPLKSAPAQRFDLKVFTTAEKEELKKKLDGILRKKAPRDDQQ